MLSMVVNTSWISFLIAILMGLLCSSHAHIFYVGGDDGWTLKPSENYNRWARRNRFQINDALNFKYKKGEDSVLVVSKKDYKRCNKDNPIQTLKDGNSTFKFEKSGPFFFISGHEQNCEKGQKLIVAVLSDRHRNPNISPSPAPQSPIETPSKSPSLSPPNNSPSPSPIVKAPSHPIEPHSPSPSPLTKIPGHGSPVEPHFHSPSPSPLTKIPGHGSPVEPHFHSPSPSPLTKISGHGSPVEPPSHSPSPSPATKTLKHAPPIESPSHSPFKSPLAKTPSYPIEPHSYSPTPTPTNPTHKPYIETPSHSPSPSQVSHHSPLASPYAQPLKNNASPPCSTICRISCPRF